MSEAALQKFLPETAADPDALQRRASDPDFSVWVGASAGSGKTTVLTKRVMRLLLAGVAPQRILCLTYTRAAAAEMAIRVMQGLGFWATCSDEELRASLDQLQGHAPQEKEKEKQLTEARRLFARLLACPGGMRIRTIHAFCQEVLRRFPVEAGLPPHFSVIEEGDARALQEEVREGLLRDAARAPASAAGRALRQLTRDLGEHGFAEIMRCLLADRARFQEALARQGGLEKLIAGLRARLDLAPEDSEESLCRAAVDAVLLPEADLRQAAQRLAEGSKSFAERAQKLLAWMELPADARAAAFEHYCGCFLTGDKTVRDQFASKELLKKYPGLGEVMRREAVRLLSFCERIEAARIAEGTAALLTLGAEWIGRYQAKKRAQALLDYEDLIVHAEALLRRSGFAPWVLYKLDGGLDHILVDEAQDTSRAQWSIIAALAEEFFAGEGAREGRRTLFAVGDGKQSIFSFQHADPEAFAAMRLRFSRKIPADAYRDVPLNISFRSAPGILRAVDAVFAMAHARAGVSGEAVAHQAHRRELPGRVEVWPLIPAAEQAEEDGEWLPPRAYETERDPEAELAAQIAGRIEGWRARKENLPGEGRPIAPGDIMILLRKRGRLADLLVRALKARGVPVTGVDRMVLVEQLAVMDLLALMQFALLPEDDLTLAAVLRGSLIGLSEEQLMALAIGRAGSLWQSLKESSETGQMQTALPHPLPQGEGGNSAVPPNGSDIFAAARDYLARLLDAADFLTPFAMIARLLSDPCPGSAAGGKQALWARLGPDALDPIDELLNAAQEFGRRRAPSLQMFLQWLLASEAEIKRENPHAQGSGGGQVRIMTVHAAKGLEAPVVFLPDAAGVPREQDLPKLLWDEEYGLPFYIPRQPQAGFARRLRERAKQKQMEEYRRLLYVALTRAASRLYIGGWETGKKTGKKESESENENRKKDQSWHALIREALAPHHEEHAVEKDAAPAPLVAFADPEPEKRDTARASSAGTDEAVPALPGWARRAPPAEAAPKRVAPSKIAAFAAPWTGEEAREEPPSAPPDRFFARGRIIHRLLESLPEMEDARREEAAARYLANPRHLLGAEEQREIAGEVLALLRDARFAPLFGADSRAEVPLAGRVDGKEITGQVDRLCVREDAVWIVDYKSNRPPPSKAEDVPDAYRAQLFAYRDVLKAVYPGKAIRCFLLWTYRPVLMEVE